MAHEDGNMWWKRKKKEADAHRKAKHAAIKAVTEANKNLRDIIEENHFTIRIYSATGGKINKGDE